MLHVSLSILNEKVCFMRTLEASGLVSAFGELLDNHLWTYFHQDTNMSGRSRLWMFANGLNFCVQASKQSVDRQPRQTRTTTT